MIEIIPIFKIWYDTNSCDYSDFFTTTTCANNLTGGIFMPLLLLTVFIISMIGMTLTSKSVFRGLTISGFICSILSILMVLMNMLNSNYMYISFFLTAIGIVGVILSEALS